MEHLTPQDIEAYGKALVAILAAIGALGTSLISAYFTWKNRYELDKLYAAEYRPNPDGTPGPMRRHPKFMVKLFTRRAKRVNKTKLN